MNCKECEYLIVDLFELMRNPLCELEGKELMDDDYPCPTWCPKRKELKYE